MKKRTAPRFPCFRNLHELAFTCFLSRQIQVLALKSWSPIQVADVANFFEWFLTDHFFSVVLKHSEKIRFCQELAMQLSASRSTLQADLRAEKACLFGHAEPLFFWHFFKFRKCWLKSIPINFYVFQSVIFLCDFVSCLQLKTLLTLFGRENWTLVASLPFDFPISQGFATGWSHHHHLSTTHSSVMSSRRQDHRRRQNESTRPCGDLVDATWTCMTQQTTSWVDTELLIWLRIWHELLAWIQYLCLKIGPSKWIHLISLW